jgi:cold shock CspA family protein
MPQLSKIQEQEKFLKVSRQMFSQKKDFVGEEVEFGLVGQIVFWNEEKNFGFIRTRDMDSSDESYYCHGSTFVNLCGVKDIVKFDVWQNYNTGRQKAINVRFEHPATTKIAEDKIGTLTRWFGLSQKGIINSDGKEYRCSLDDFEQRSVPSCNSRVCFDIIKDNWNSTETKVHSNAANIRVEKIVRHIHHAGAEGRVVKLSRSYGFVSTKLCDHDIYFNSTELTRVHMQDIHYNDRIIFDAIMEEDGSLTAENINMCKTRQLVAEARQLVADFSSGAVDDTAKKVPAKSSVKKELAVADDCASTAASDLPEATPELINAELRKLSKKLREIRGLEGRHDLDQLQQAKVAKKQEYQQLLERLTA